MRLTIVAVGRIGRGPEAELVTRYLARIPWPTAVIEVDRSAPPTPPGCVSVFLDERGAALASRAFAERLSEWRDAGTREVRFLIGGADGHTEATRATADLLLGLGPATWPHLLARAMLAEQLYRAVTLIAGHPYHRD